MFWCRHRKQLRATYPMVTARFRQSTADRVTVWLRKGLIPLSSCSTFIFSSSATHALANDVHIPQEFYDHPFFPFSSALLLIVICVILYLNRRKLQESSTELETIYNGIVDGIIVADVATGDIVQVNDQACRMFGYRRSELLTKNPLKDLHPPDAREQVTAHFAEFREGFESRREDVPCLRADGSVFFTDIGSRLITLKGRLCVAGFFHDITVRKATEELFREREQLWQFAIQGSRDGVWDWNIAENSVYFSPRWKKILGYEDHELPNRLESWRDHLHPDDLAPALSAIDRYFHHEMDIFEIEVRMRCNDGSYRWILSRGKVTSWGEEGQALRMIGTHTDIHDRKEAEGLLQQSEFRLAEAQRIARIGSWELDLTTGRLVWSDEVFRIFELDKNRISASYDMFLSHIHPDDRDMVNTAYRSSLATQKPYRITHRLTFPDGRIKWVEEQCETLFTAEGSPLRSLGTVHDITERVLAEHEVERARDEWARTFDAVPDLIAIIDNNYTILRANKTMADALGMTSEEVAGKRCYECIHGSDSPPPQCPHNRSLLDGREHTEEVFEPCLGGHVMVTASPLYDAAGVFIGSVHVARNINKRVQAETSLRESEERYRLISGMISDFVYSCRRSKDTPYRIDWIAGAMEIISGYSNNEIQNLGCWLHLVHEADRESSFAALRTLSPGESAEWACRLVTRSGDIRWIQTHATCSAEDNDILIIYGAAQDITERKLAFDKLTLSEERYRLIAEHMGDIICVHAPDGTYTFVSPSVAKTLGYTFSEMLGKSPYDFTHPDDITSVLQPYHEALASGKIGASIIEVRNRTKDGRWIWLESSVTPVLNAEGALVWALSASRDITERKAAQEQIVASLREKELLLKEIHHRVKNNLQIISSLLNLQASHIKAPELVPLFMESQNRVRTMALIHEKLYRSDNLAVIDFGAYIRELTGFLFRTYRTGAARVGLEITTDEITFGIDTAVPCGLLINELVSNALKHAFPANTEGMLRISLRQSENSCILIVADDGLGLPDGFSINKTATLGMELIRSLSQQLDGRLEINQHHGTTFMITFNRKG